MNHEITKKFEESAAESNRITIESYKKIQEIAKENGYSDILEIIRQTNEKHKKIMASAFEDLKKSSPKDSEMLGILMLGVLAKAGEDPDYMDDNDSKEAISDLMEIFT